MRFFVVTAALTALGCQHDHPHPDKPHSHGGEDKAEAAAALTVDPGADRPIAVGVARAALAPTAGNDVRGQVTLEQTDEGVRVQGEVTGLKPGSTHGWHVHVYGDCTGDDGKSAGTHFNFAGSSLNPPKDIDHITGNLGDLTADDAGKASVDVTIEKASLHGRYAIIGRSIIIHEKANDPSQPPIGGAGGRLACGVIGIAEPR